MAFYRWKVEFSPIFSPHQESLLVTLHVRNCLWRYVGLAARLKKGPKSVMTRPMTLSSLCQRKFVILTHRRPVGSPPSSCRNLSPSTSAQSFQNRYIIHIIYLLVTSPHDEWKHCFHYFWPFFPGLQHKVFSPEKSGQAPERAVVSGWNPNCPWRDLWRSKRNRWSNHFCKKSLKVL